jgi:hypothetical protein
LRIFTQLLVYQGGFAVFMKNIGRSIVVLLALALFSTSCGQTDITTPAVTAPPVTTTAATTSVIPLLPVTTGAAANIGVSGAVLNGSFSGPAALERGFEWGVNSGKFEYSWAESGNFQPGAFSREISGLAAGTTCYFRSKARNSTGWAYGEEKSFKTLAPPKITAVTPDSAKQGDNLLVVITGADFTGAASVSFGDNITVNKFTVTGDTKISANITIAGRAAGGIRTVSVATPAGTAALAASFRVDRVLRTVVWTDENFDWLSHFLTGNVRYTYHIHLQAGNKMYVTSVLNFNFGIEVRDGKLCFTNVPASAWDNVYYTSYPHLRYDTVNQVMITDSLPLEVLQKLFNPPENTMPRIESLTTSEGTITITYYSP